MKCKIPADRISARLEITLSREVKSYLLENYLPSTLFVSMSWGSFVGEYYANQIEL